MGDGFFIFFLNTTPKEKKIKRIIKNHNGFLINLNTKTICKFFRNINKNNKLFSGNCIIVYIPDLTSLILFLSSKNILKYSLIGILHNKHFFKPFEIKKIIKKMDEHIL